MNTIHAVPAFQDNYIWMLENANGTALVVDPGDAAPVEQALRARGLQLAAILLTHHHFDHVGGVPELKAQHACAVYGPDNPGIAHIDHVMREGDALSLGDYHFEVLSVPGHTLDHIAYFQAAAAAGDTPLLFCGDTLFAGGCGRLFEGHPAMMADSLAKIAALPDATQVYCAHEYTLANLRFARAAEPDNAALAARETAAQATRARGLATVPSTVGLERATNPFLRCAQPGVRAGLTMAGHSAGNTPVETFAALRAWKDNF